MRKYRPSNGTEGDLFMANYCEQCVHDNYPEEPFCHILADSMAYFTDDPKYPNEWIYGEDGQPTCTEFIEEDKP